MPPPSASAHCRNGRARCVSRHEARHDSSEPCYPYRRYVGHLGPSVSALTDDEVSRFIRTDGSERNTGIISSDEMVGVAAPDPGLVEKSRDPRRSETGSQGPPMDRVGLEIGLGINMLESMQTALRCFGAIHSSRWVLLS